MTDEDQQNPEPGTVAYMMKKSRQKKSEPTKQSTNQSTDQSTNSQEDSSSKSVADFLKTDPSRQRVERPKAFYISKRLDKNLDKAVNFYKDKLNMKIDRSVIVNAFLDNEELFIEKNLEKKAKRVFEEMASRLTS